MKINNKITTEEQDFFDHLHRSEVKHISKDIDNDWRAIERRIGRKKRSKHIRFVRYFSAAAAVVLVLISTSVFLYNYFQVSDTDQYSALISKIEKQGNSQDVTLIVDGNKLTTTNEKAQISYDANGVVQLDDKIIETDNAGKNKPEDNYNCVIVPKGKQTFLTLSDGTKIHVNSRSRVIYPKVFAKNKREIYIEGEAFLKVTHNADAPFIVKTSNFDVKVLGTTFNVCSYKEIENSTITLVEGSVSVNDKNRNTVKLKPSEVVNVNKGQVGTPEYTDVSQYVDWVYGYYLFSEATLSEVFTKLSFYYDVNFKLASNIRDIKVNGKLDIQMEIDDVLANLSKVADIQFTKEGNQIYVDLK